jgi:hypothetical protein
MWAQPRAAEVTFEMLFFDSPNYFTTLWGDEYTEAKTKVVRLTRNPHLFSIIYEYLSGYEVRPDGTL